MSEKELKMFDVDAQLDAAFGKEGTPGRRTAEDKAQAFFTGQIIEEARKKANMTQAELAEKTRNQQILHFPRRDWQDGAESIYFLPYRLSSGINC